MKCYQVIRGWKGLISVSQLLYFHIIILKPVGLALACIICSPLNVQKLRVYKYELFKKLAIFQGLLSI